MLWRSMAAAARPGRRPPSHARALFTLPPASAALDLRSAPSDDSMMTLWTRVKSAYPDSLVLFQNGDFYEIFDSDVEPAIDILNIREANRAPNKDGKPRYRMAGVPVKAVAPYLGKLAQNNMTVVIVEQDPEAPTVRGQKIKSRKVTRVVTPGTLTDDEMLEPGASNLLMACCCASNEWLPNAHCAVATIDVSTGGPVSVSSLQLAGLHEHCLVASPRELILPLSSRKQMLNFIADIEAAGCFVSLVPHGDQHCPSVSGKSIASPSLGDFSRIESMAVQTLQGYVARTLMVAPMMLRATRADESASLHMDSSTLASMEVLRGRHSGTRDGSLLGGVNKTISAVGSRLLASRIAAPSRDVREINSRLDAVEIFLRDPDARARIRSLLRGLRDGERALQRLLMGRWQAEDLGTVKLALTVAKAIAEAAPLNLPELSVLKCTAPLSKKADAANNPPDISDLLPGSEKFNPRTLCDLEEEMQRALGSSSSGQGSASVDGLDYVVASKYSLPLDAARKATDLESSIASMEVQARARTGIKSLRIVKGTKNQLAFYVSKAALSKSLAGMPEEFRLAQVMVSGSKYVTNELVELERAARKGESEADHLQSRILDWLRAHVVLASNELRGIVEALARVDVDSALGELAHEHSLSRPIVDESLVLDVVGGRHLLVEKSRPFVANDCRVAGKAQDGLPQVLLMTAPNTSGKSTFLRANAAIVILAQMGSFVPAKACRVGIVDRVFSRIGASDEIANARSTFMVEMEETALFLSRATARSLVVVDELGRGTSPKDGLAIAWAVLEELVALGCRSLFATHFHELARHDVGEQGAGGQIEYVTTRVVKGEDQRPVFTFKVERGVAEGSFGLHVASLAGLPAHVLKRAQVVFDELSGDGGGGKADPRR